MFPEPKSYPAGMISILQVCLVPFDTTRTAAPFPGRILRRNTSHAAEHYRFFQRGCSAVKKPGKTPVLTLFADRNSNSHRQKRRYMTLTNKKTSIQSGQYTGYDR
jgi:hypothetical protein